MAIVLIIIAFIALIVGFFSLSNATMGVGGVAVACFFGILARIAQADSHHKELKKLLITKEDVSL